MFLILNLYIITIRINFSLIFWINVFKLHTRQTVRVRRILNRILFMLIFIVWIMYLSCSNYSVYMRFSHSILITVSSAIRYFLPRYRPNIMKLSRWYLASNIYNLLRRFHEWIYFLRFLKVYRKITLIWVLNVDRKLGCLKKRFLCSINIFIIILMRTIG